MAKWRIDTLTPQEIAKYRQRSFDAINGIEYLLKYANVIAQYEKISDKYKTIAEYIGLGQEGGNSFYNYFIPLNADIVFLLRNSNHNTTNPYLYNRHEQLGRPNKRYIVYFKNGNTFSDNPITLLDAEHHSISYDVNALDNETSVIAYLNSLKGLFENGETTFQPLPITTENKQYNKNTNMKQTIRLTGSELRNMISESVKRVLNETTVDNESILQSLKNLSENKTFVELLKWGVIKLRAEHYENADIDKMFAQKIFSSIEEAADFVNSSREQTYIYVDGGEECLNIYDIA